MGVKKLNIINDLHDKLATLIDSSSFHFFHVPVHRCSSQTQVVLFGLVALTVTGVESRRVRVRTRPVVQPEAAANNEDGSQGGEVEDSQSQGAIQYYSAEPQNQKGRVLLLAAEDEYSGSYQPQQPQLRQRADYNIPSAGTRHTQQQQQQPRTKENSAKEPPVQTIRNYSKVNDDGSFTFGYEAADGSFKEETRGTDCVVRGKYGYVDPDGNKREFTYVSGNPCDPNNPDGEEEAPEEDLEENLPQNQNYPKRVPQQQRPAPRPAIQTTTRPTTVFQNNYNPYGGGSAEEEEENVPSFVAPRPVRPLIRNQESRPTTPASVRYSPVTITPRPVQSQPPATTYRPQVAVTQKPVTFQSFPSTTPVSIDSSRRPIDFASEFQKFQDDNTGKSSAKSPASGGNAIYQSQLVFDPSTGQYDANLYQQLPKAAGDFELSQRIQPYVSQPQPQYAPQLVTLDQLRNGGQQPAYARPQIQNFGPTRPPQIQIPQFSQQHYQKSQENLQVLNSQQLFAQQTQLAQQQLHSDRIKAAERQIGGGSAAQRFNYQPIQTRPPTQAYYFLPQQSGQAGSGSLGQIDAFLKGQNVEY